MIKREHILSLVKNRISKIDPDIQIILFGSRARKDATSDSDWDFLILTKNTLTADLKNRILDELFETELETDEVLTGIIQNKYEWSEYEETPIYKHIQADGIAIWQAKIWLNTAISEP